MTKDFTNSAKEPNQQNNKTGSPYTNAAHVNTTPAHDAIHPEIHPSDNLSAYIYTKSEPLPNGNAPYSPRTGHQVNVVDLGNNVALATTEAVTEDIIEHIKQTHTENINTDNLDGKNTDETSTLLLLGYQQNQQPSTQNIEQPTTKSTADSKTKQSSSAATETTKESDSTATQPTSNKSTNTDQSTKAQKSKKNKENDSKAEREAKLEAYKQFLAEQANNHKIDYQQIRINIEASALPSKMYFIMNALSAIIASYGLVVNSAAVVIGAMLVAMMLGPISGVALAIIDYRMPLLRRSLMTVLAGGVMVIGIGFIIGLLHQGQPLTNEILSRTQPTSMDLMIALAGGTAGAYAMISPNLSVAVVGVAVATALVPPLAASGILFAYGEGSLGLGALLLAITNIIAIQFTNALVLWISGFRRLVDDDYKTRTYLTFLRRNAVTLLLLSGLGIYLTINLDTIARQQRFENYVQDTISNYFIDDGNVLTATQFINRNNSQTIRAVLRGERPPTPKDVQKLEQLIDERLKKSYPNAEPVQLQLRYLPVIVIESHSTDVDRINRTDGAILSTSDL